MILIEDVRKKYKDCNALNGITMKINDGEIFGMLGPNGAGKTTLIKILTGIINDYEGNIIYNGELLSNIVNNSNFKRNVGVVPQDNIFFEKLTAKENLELFLQFQDVEKSKWKEKIEELLRSVNLWEKADVQVATYSGGMKRRLNIALALVSNPSLIFMDEPTVGLDPEVRREIWELIEMLNNKGLTIVITTHYMEEAEYLCQRIGIVNKGKVVVSGKIDEVKDHMGRENSSLEKTYLSALEQEAE